MQAEESLAEAHRELSYAEEAKGYRIAYLEKQEEKLSHTFDWSKKHQRVS